MALEEKLQELIEKRREIDRALLERHAVDMAVLFTDIVGSTAYFEQRGDIEGLALVHRHNDLLFPVVKEHRGRVVKTIGDSIMAVFRTAADGVACAVALQERLATETGTAAVERIRIRVGVHFGRVLKDNDDVFGDTVNTAARVASAAGADEVLVSQAAFDLLPRAARPATAPRTPLAAKGKSEPVPVVVIAWRAGDKADAAARAPEAQELFVLELARTPGGLRVAALDGEAERGTVKPYADVALSSASLSSLGEPFAMLAHDGGQAAYVATVVERGRALFAQALPERVQRRLAGTERRTMRLHLDDTLVHVPWELMHDGADFLGCRFALGRMVAAEGHAVVPPPSSSSRDAVVLANAAGDLPHAEEEGRTVARLLAQAVGPQRVVHEAGPITRARFLALAARARVLHVAGHATPEGFVVSDGVVTAVELRRALAQGAPLLVFANGCHASTGAPWRAEAAASLAQALLLAGVRHTLAPLWSVPDADALAFALRFYESALAGVPFGESARRARKALSSTSGAAPLSFAGYVLYGDPRACLPAEDATLSEPGRTRSGDFPPVIVPPVLTPPTSAEPTLAPPGATRSPSSSRAKPVVAGVVGGLAVALVVVGAWAFTRPIDQAAPAAAPVLAVETAPRTDARDAVATLTGSHVPHTGPVRVSVMPFKSTGGADATLDYLKLGLTEVLVTTFAEARGVQLIERGQIDVDIAEVEFSQSKYVDVATRAQLGKIVGAEVAVLGAYQLAGEALRFTARFIDVQTGEVLAAVKVDGTRADPFALQDALAAAAKSALADVVAKERP